MFTDNHHADIHHPLFVPAIKTGRITDASDGINPLSVIEQEQILLEFWLLMVTGQIPNHHGSFFWVNQHSFELTYFNDLSKTYTKFTTTNRREPINPFMAMVNRINRLHELGVITRENNPWIDEFFMSPRNDQYNTYQYRSLRIWLTDYSTEELRKKPTMIHYNQAGSESLQCSITVLSISDYLGNANFTLMAKGSFLLYPPSEELSLLMPTEIEFAKTQRELPIAVWS